MTLLFADGLHDRLWDQGKYDTVSSVTLDTYVDSRHAGEQQIARWESTTGASRLGVNVGSRTVVAAGVAHRPTRFAGDERRELLQFRTAAGILVCINRETGEDTLEVRQGGYDGTLIASATGFGWSATSLAHLSVQVEVAGASSRVQVWVDEVATIDQTVDLGSDPITEVALSPRSVTDDRREATFEDLWVTDGDVLLDARVQSRRADGLGAHNDWTSSDADANWEQVNVFPPDLNEFVSAFTSGDRDSHTIADLLADTRPDVYAIQTNLVVSKDGVDTWRAGDAIRVGTTDYDGPLTEIPGAVNTLLRRVVADNPDTAASWTKASVDAAEFGYQAVSP